MARHVIYVRYALLLILSVFFSIQASAAAWNLQFTSSTLSHERLDAFLIFCGAFGILVIFPITAIEVARKNAVTSAVWFEAGWLSLTFIFQIAGAAALTALLPQMACGAIVAGFRDNACISTAVLTGFTWTIAMTVLLYLIGLIVITFLHLEQAPNVWKCGVCDFPWFEHAMSGQRLDSPPPSSSKPVLPRSLPTRPPSLLAPKPTRAVAPAWSTYDVEAFYQAPPLVRQMAPAPRQPPPAAAPTFYSRPVAAALPRIDTKAVPAPPPTERTTGSSPGVTSPSNPGRSSSPSSGSRTPRTPRKQRPRPPPLNLVDSNYRDS